MKLLALGFVVLLAVGLHVARDHFEYDKAEVAIASEPVGGEEAYDGSVLSHEGDLWFAWLEFEPGFGDRLLVGRRGRDERVEVATGRIARPTLTADTDGNLWLTYEAREEGSEHWNVFARLRRDDGSFDDPRPVGRPGGNNIRHDVAADPHGSIWVVYQGAPGGQFEIFSRVLSADPARKTVPVLVSRSPLGDWHPSVDVAPNGWVYIVWDSFDGESFNVLGRRHEGDYWSRLVELAGGAAFQGRAKVACDSRNAVWVQWEEGGENWGGEYRSRNEVWNNFTDRRGPLHRLRRLRMGRWLTDGSFVATGEPFPMPSLGRRVVGRREGVSDAGIFYERGELLVDMLDRPWVVYRHYADFQLQRDEPVVHHIEEGWNVYARCLTDEGWSPLVGFDVAQRDGMQRLALARHRDGVAAVWTTGRTDRRKDERRRGLAFATATVAGDAPPLEDRGWRKTRAPKGISLSAEASRGAFEASIGPEGEEHTLFFGDLHRHTDLSLCFPFVDGSLDDAYRYAIEVAKLDFLGITDHARDIDRGDVQSQLWWRSIKEVERHQLNDTFFPYFAYERSHRDTDHNVISLRDDMLRNFPPPLPEFWNEIEDADTFTIPHNPFIGKVWEHHDDAKRPLLEIYQGFRDQSSESHAHAGLAKGYHMGFIASSDHLSTGASYACVWSPQADRESIFRSLQARRTYGATDKITLLFHTGEHFMGERITAALLPDLYVTVAGTADVERIEFVRDGEVVKRVQGGASPWLDAKLPGGAPVIEETWTYVHVVQVDGNEAWSSPIWMQAP